MVEQARGGVLRAHGVDPEKRGVALREKAAVDGGEDVLVRRVCRGDAQILAPPELGERVRLGEQALPAAGEREKFLPRLRQLDAACFPWLWL